MHARNCLWLKLFVAVLASQNNRRSEQAMVEHENSVTLSGNWDALAGLSAPAKKRGVGRPATSGEKVLQHLQTSRSQKDYLPGLGRHAEATSEAF